MKESDRSDGLDARERERPSERIRPGRDRWKSMPDSNAKRAAYLQQVHESRVSAAAKRRAERS